MLVTYFCNTAERVRRSVKEGEERGKGEGGKMREKRRKMGNRASFVSTAT